MGKSAPEWGNQPRSPTPRCSSLPPGPSRRRRFLGHRGYARNADASSQIESSCPGPATSPRTLPAGTAKPTLVWGRKEKASRGGEAESPQHLCCPGGASAALPVPNHHQGLPRGSPVPFVQGWTAAGTLSTCTHGTHACSIPTPGVAGDPKPLTRLHQTPSHVQAGPGGTPSPALSGQTSPMPQFPFLQPWGCPPLAQGAAGGGTILAAPSSQRHAGAGSPGVPGMVVVLLCGETAAVPEGCGPKGEAGLGQGAGTVRTPRPRSRHHASTGQGNAASQPAEFPAPIPFHLPAQGALSGGSRGASERSRSGTSPKSDPTTAQAARACVAGRVLLVGLVGGVMSACSRRAGQSDWLQSC